MKACIICNVSQPLSEYYKHKQMGDGHLNKCKSCCKAQQIERHHKLMEDEEWVKKERARGRDKYKSLGYNSLPKSTENKGVNLYKYKNQSRNFKTEKGVEVHHWSYNEIDQEDVFFLSIRIHRQIHQFIIFDEGCQYFRCKITNELLDTREKHYKYFLDKGYDLNNNLKIQLLK